MGIGFPNKPLTDHGSLVIDCNVWLEKESQHLGTSDMVQILYVIMLQRHPWHVTRTATIALPDGHSKDACMRCMRMQRNPESAKTESARNRTSQQWDSHVVCTYNTELSFICLCSRLHYRLNAMSCKS
jgi:hypothetical protein